MFTIALAATFVLLVVASITAVAVLVRSDGYGPRPDRTDRFADPRRIL